MEWKPIETKPAHGETVLFVAMPQGARKIPRYGVGCFAFELLWDWDYAFPPTHWMTLPSPPQEKEE